MGAVLFRPVRKPTTIAVLLLLLASCGGGDDTASTTVPTTTVAAGQAEACAAVLETYEVAIEAWYAQYGTNVHPDEADLVAGRFVVDDTPAGYVEVVPGSGTTPSEAMPGPNC